MSSLLEREYILTGGRGHVRPMIKQKVNSVVKMVPQEEEGGGGAGVIWPIRFRCDVNFILACLIRWNHFRPKRARLIEPAAGGYASLSGSPISGAVRFQPAAGVYTAVSEHPHYGDQ